MKWQKHYELTDKHAFLSPSGYAWLRYTPETLTTRYINSRKKEEGTLLHVFASTAIMQRIKLAPLKRALNQFVNDAIGFDMESEQILYYSEHCFGTADAIRYSDNTLRVHDLKTGTTKVSFDQLLVYSALFCLEYSVKPKKTEFICRIYQGSGFQELMLDPADVKVAMDTIISHDAVLDNLKNTL